MASSFMAVTAAKTAAAKAKLQRSHKINRCRDHWTTFWSSIFRKKPLDIPTAGELDDDGIRVVQQKRAITWPELSSFVSTGLSGYWALSVFLLVGFTAAHLTGPSAVVSILIAGVACFITGTVH